MENNNPRTQLFTELFRPKTLEQAILVPRVREELSRGLVDNILFYGTQGTGKTCCSRILASYGGESLTINASMENGIDVIRDQIVSFASTSSLLDGHERMKVVVLEECDNMSDQAWKALRANIEKFHSSCRFIANCNYIDKIPEPIQSRFNCICLEAINPEEEKYLLNAYKERLGKIFKAINISVEDSVLEEFIKIDYPDLRTLIKKVQQLNTRSVRELTHEMLSNTFDCSELYKIILSSPDPVNNYKVLTKNWTNKADDAILKIGKEFVNFVINFAPNKASKIPLAVIAIAEHNAQLSTSIDKFVTLLSLVYKLQLIFNE